MQAINMILILWKIKTNIDFILTLSHAQLSQPPSLSGSRVLHVLHTIYRYSTKTKKKLIELFHRFKS